jgi:sulfatase modifying factor 1
MPALNNLFTLLLLVFSNQLLHAQHGNFILVPGGEYTIGKLNHQLNPLRKVRVDSFYISSTETTNQQFENFIKATSYKTDAERSHNAMVFQPGLKEFEWMKDSTAYWRFPNGTSRGGIENKMNHPVTCISYNDIMAYCKWAGVRLPTLEEWEIASRAGANTDYYFGNDKSKIAVYANTWLGRDHLKADSTDGFMYTSPVASFTPNAWGLFDMYGNVFEFCTGKLKKDQDAAVVHARGGSWWCSKNACNFFNSYDIGRVHRRASFSNQGFREVKIKN